MATVYGIRLEVKERKKKASNKTMSLQYPLNPLWNLSARALIRKHFRDKYPTRDIEWSKSAAILQEEHPRLIGVCLVEESGLLRYLVVKEEFREKGYGTLLLQTCLHDITHLTCMEHRISFYEKNGFHLQGPSSKPELWSMTKQNGKVAEINCSIHSR